MIEFKNAVTGRRVRCLEPGDTPDRCRASRASRIKRFRAHPDWVSVGDPADETLQSDEQPPEPPPGAPADPPPDSSPPDSDDPDSARPPSALQIRKWARAQGIEVPDRGKLPPEIVDAYDRAHAS